MQSTDQMSAEGCILNLVVIWPPTETEGVVYETRQVWRGERHRPVSVTTMFEILLGSSGIG